MIQGFRIREPWDDALTDELGQGDILLADKGYDSNAIRAKAAERKAWANIPRLLSFRIR